MTPETYIVRFWRAGAENHCQPVSIAQDLGYNEAIEVSESLRARGYKVLVYELRQITNWNEWARK